MCSLRTMQTWQVPSVELDQVEGEEMRLPCKAANVSDFGPPSKTKSPQITRTHRADIRYDGADMSKADMRPIKDNSGNKGG
jgi:hypothetical protein